MSSKLLLCSLGVSHDIVISSLLPQYPVTPAKIFCCWQRRKQGSRYMHLWDLSQLKGKTECFCEHGRIKPATQVAPAPKVCSTDVHAAFSGYLQHLHKVSSASCVKASEVPIDSALRVMATSCTFSLKWHGNDEGPTSATFTMLSNTPWVRPPKHMHLSSSLLRVFTPILWIKVSGGKSQNINFKLQLKENSISILNIWLAFKKRSYLLKYMKNSNPSSKFNLQMICTSFNKTANLDNLWQYS